VNSDAVHARENCSLNTGAFAPDINQFAVIIFP